MQFYISETHATAARAGKIIAIDRPPAANIAGYFAGLGFRPLAAGAIALGALDTREGAIGLGQSLGLLAGGSVWSGRAIDSQRRDV